MNQSREILLKEESTPSIEELLNKKKGNINEDHLRNSRSSSNYLPQYNEPDHFQDWENKEEDESQSNQSFEMKTLQFRNRYPFTYPGSIEDALFHEQANILGSDSQLDSKCQNISNECKCCGKTVTKIKLKFFNLDIKAITGIYGRSLSYLFNMNKLFILQSFLLISIYFFYFQYQVENLCVQKKDDTNQNGESTSYNCLTIMRMSIMSEVQLRRESSHNVQVWLADLKFALFIGLQITNILFFQSSNLLKENKKNQEEETHKLQQLRKKSLLIKDLSQWYSDKDLEKNIKLLVKNTYNLSVKIVSITQFDDLYEKHSLAEERIKLLQKFYQSKVGSDKVKLKNELMHNYQVLNSLKNHKFSGKIIVTFQSQKDAFLVYNLLQKSYFLEVTHMLKKTFGLSNEVTNRRLVCQKAPQLNEIKWENMGSNIKYKWRLVLLFITFLLLIFIGFPQLTSYLYEAQFQNQQESIEDKTIDYSISFILFIISIFVWRGMEFILKQLKLSTTFYESINMITFNLAFHLSFYIFGPIYLTYFSLPFNKLPVDFSIVNIRLYGIATLISGFSGFCLAEIFFNPSAIYHTFTKWWIQKKKLQLFQQILNVKFQRPAFPIEKRIILLYKLHIFGVVASFIVPLSWTFILVGLILQLIGNRLSIIKYFSLYSYQNTKIVSISTRIASLALIYVVSLSYLITESYDGFFTRDIYIQFAKYVLIFNVLSNTLIEKVYKAIKLRRKMTSILEKKVQQRRTSVSADKRNQSVHSSLYDKLFAYYNTYLYFQVKIHPDYLNQKVQNIINQ